MKTTITAIALIVSVASFGQKLVFKNSTGITGKTTYSKTENTLILSLTPAAVGLSKANNTSDLDKPLSNEAKKALSLKADKVALDALQLNLSGMRSESIQISRQSVSDTKTLRDSILLLFNNLSFVYRQYLGLKQRIDTVPELNFVGFNGKGDSTKPLTNGPLEMTEADRLAIKNPKHNLQVATPKGTWGINSVTGWKQIF